MMEKVLPLIQFHYLFRLAATRQTASGIALWHIHLYCILLNFLGEESVAEEDKRSRTSDAIKEASLEGGLRKLYPPPPFRNLKKESVIQGALWHIHLYCILLNFLGEESVTEKDKRSHTSEAIKDASLVGGWGGSTPNPHLVI